MKMNTLSSCLPVYARQLGFQEDFELRKCGDVFVGEIRKDASTLWFEKDLRLRNDLKIDNKTDLRTAVIILESPHTAEYDGDFVSPALGTTGRNLQRHFEDVFRSVCNDGEYRIILMNSIQYQCSLGVDTNRYRDNMWLKLWFKETLRRDFIDRLVSYKPDIIFNFCTCGSHTMEEGLPQGCKSSLNTRYIEHCIAPLTFDGDSPTSLKKLVHEALSEAGITAEIYEGSHPCAWRIRNSELPECKKDVIGLTHEEVIA